MKQQKSLHKVLAENIGFVFVLPWLIGFLLFKVYPFASSLYYSFTNYDMFSGISKYGMMNYNKIFTDEDILRAFKVTFKYAIFDVPLKLAFALFIAYILNFKLKGVNFFRTAYYIPSILGGSIAIAILWRAVFNTDGLINTVITAFGLPKINWMASDNGALAVIVLLRVWQFGSAMVIFLAGLQSIDKTYYEAAGIDGATIWQQIRYVPGVQRTVLSNQGWTKRCDNPDFCIDLQQRILTSQDGYGKCTGMGTVHHRMCVDRYCVCQPEKMGLLF